MSDHPKWRVHFTQRELGFIEAEFDDLVLRDRTDVDEWEARVRRKLSQFGPEKVWLLINLDGLSIHPVVGPYFGERRAKVLSDHTKASVRFGGDRRTVTNINTSHVLHGAAANMYPSREDAVEALMAAMHEASHG